MRTRGQPSAPGDGFSTLRPHVPGRRSGGHARGKPQTCAGQGGVKPSRPRGPAAGRPGGRRARAPARPPRGSLRGPCLGRSPRCGTGTGEGSAEATPPGLPSGVREARQPLPLTPRAPAHAGKAGRRGCHARGDVAESGAEELLDSGEACNPVRLSGSFNVRFHTAPEGAILDEASRMFFEHPSRDAFGSKDTEGQHSPRGCRCAACSNWRERVPSSTAGRTSSLNGTAEVSRARTLLSGRNPRRSPKQWPGEHTSGPGDGAWLTCVRVRAGARFLGCCGPRLACGCDGKCARPQGQRTRVHWKRPRLWHPPPGPLDTEVHGT